MSAPNVTDNRDSFPRGLAQPACGFRFSADALLLACFAANRVCRRVLDLGAGCGVVGLGLLLHLPDADIQVIGVDCSPDMVEAATANATALGLDHRYRAVLGDVRAMAEIADCAPNAFDLVLCNPPYRQPGHGRLPPDPDKQAARFETSADLEDFFQAAARSLDTKGRLALVHLPEHLHRIFTALAKAGLEPKRLRLVHGREDKAASLLLLEARKAVRPGLRIEPPLLLYAQKAQGSELTQDARAFCPFLACNSLRPAPSLASKKSLRATQKIIPCADSRAPSRAG